MKSLTRFAFLGLPLCFMSLAAREHVLTLAPAAFDRAGQVIRFQLPPDVPAGAVARAGADEAALPLQRNPDGTATLIVPRQRAGQTVTLRLGAGPADARVTVERDARKLRVSVEGQAAFDYQMDKEALPRADIKPEYKRAGYIHPVFTAAGTIVSDDYPPQHIHHHGIWSPWTKTSFQGRTPDFWNMGAKTGTVEFVAVDRTWSGPVHGGFVARHRFVDLSAPSPVVALHETWEVVAYRVPAPAGAGLVRVFDLTITQTCATSDPLILPEYHYGGLGFRGRGEWFGADKADFLTSEGVTDRVKAHASKVRWIAISGAVERGTAAMALLGHPGNFRAPQPVRVHPKEPFICFAPQQGGEFRIEPGKPYVSRYRFVAVDGAPDRSVLDAFWYGYVNPAEVTIVSR